METLWKQLMYLSISYVIVPVTAQPHLGIARSIRQKESGRGRMSSGTVTKQDGDLKENSCHANRSRVNSIGPKLCYYNVDGE